MAGKVSSDLGSATAAVSQFNTGKFSSQHFSLRESNISGMKSAEKISNSIIGDLSKLEMIIINVCNDIASQLGLEHLQVKEYLQINYFEVLLPNLLGIL